MATNVQGYNTGVGVNALTAEQHTYYQDAMLERLIPELVWTKFGEKKNIPKRKGATTNFRRLNSLNVVTTALTEGVTPDGVDLNITAINAVVKEYGNWTKISEFINLAGYDPLMTEVAELMGENAGESIDVIVRDVLSAGTNVMYAGGKTSRAAIEATDKITALDILKARRTLKRNKVKPIRLPNGGTDYVALVHTDVAMDLMQLDEWKKANIENATSDFRDGSIGRLYGIRFYEVDNGVVFPESGANDADVYGTIFLGRGAYGIPDIEGSVKPEIIVHPAGSAGSADPLNQFNTVAWKCAFAAVRLQELAIVRLESGATA
ncbi:N4-gp56 family major capsid protein [Paenibacillus sp. 3LSP]|jgi:N4-gp56 family major capsid protein|uniref:N4-gp56 family major capsid protein n=1 Tax=Paenibacillus sp. 3LSP TaxID=2800795 RepID=UPI0028FD42DF|nr:N4-gp56 family major capsid protein [Paenibacillus sp. 3LSP]MDU0328589.1 N4-gp56 family major capsid protein [Paenibacillus sp. 3LSP]